MTWTKTPRWTPCGTNSVRLPPHAYDAVKMRDLINELVEAGLEWHHFDPDFDFPTVRLVEAIEAIEAAGKKYLPNVTPPDQGMIVKS